MSSSDIFTISARRCKRCGGLLTSAQAIRDGYGSCCLRKMEREALAREEAKNQYSLFDAEPKPEPELERPYSGQCKTGWSPYGACTAIYCAEPYDCCAACPKGCNVRCGWIPERSN